VAGNWFDSSFPYVTRFFSDGRAAQVNTQVVAEAANLFVNNTGHYAFTNFSYPNGTFAALGFGTSVFRVFPNQVGDGMAGINDSGAAVGYTMAGRTFIRAAGGGVTFLPFPTGITSMSPYGINNAGQVIGQACSSQRCSEVFLYSSGNVIDLATRISPQNDYSLLNGLSDGGAFLAQDPQGNRDVIEPVKPLFVANSSNTVTAYVPPYTGAPISTTSYFVSAPDGMAFDGKRNLYVANSGTNDVTEYAPPYIAEPIATIKNGINQPKGVAFDRSTGDLFVACADSVQIYAPPYTGTPIGRLTNAVNHPDAVAFDSKRDLFVSNIGNSTITIYQPPYTGAPTVTISKGRAYPRSLALNARGDLFVGFDTKYEPPTEEVVEYAPPYTGAPIATITDDVNAPYGLAVDGSGDLFVANFSNNNVTAYAPPYTGAPFATISTGVSTPNGLAFGP
jgi:probable HAF family extracellular repeat protein